MALTRKEEDMLNQENRRYFAFIATLAAFGCSSGSGGGGTDAGAGAASGSGGVGGFGAFGGSSGSTSTGGTAGAASGGSDAGIGATGGVGATGGAAGSSGSGGSGGATGGSGGTGGGTGGTGGGSGGTLGVSENVALACGTTQCLAAWHRSGALYGVKIDSAGKPASAALLQPALSGTILTKSDYVAAEGGTLYALHETQSGSSLLGRLVTVSTTTSVKALPTLSLTSGTMSKTRLAWAHGRGMVTRRYFNSSFGSSPDVSFLSPAGAWLGGHQDFPYLTGFNFGPFSAAVSDGFVMRWDADDGVFPPDCGWAKFTKTGAKASINCPTDPQNTTVYTLRSFGGTAYSLRTLASLLVLRGDNLDGTPGFSLSSIDKQSRYLAVNATHAWTFTFAGKVERFELATKTKTGSLTLPSPGSPVGGTAVALLPGRVVVARIPSSNTSFSAIINSFPITSMDEKDIVTDVIP